MNVHHRIAAYLCDRRDLARQVEQQTSRANELERRLEQAVATPPPASDELALLGIVARKIDRHLNGQPVDWQPTLDAIATLQQRRRDHLLDRALGPATNLNP